MAWIDTTPPAVDAVGAQFIAPFPALCAEWAELTAPTPMEHLALAFALRPEALAASLQFARLVGLGGSDLGRVLEATIGLVVATRLGMAYTGAHHAQRLLAAGVPRDRVVALLHDPVGSDLDERSRAVARYCDKLTRTPGTMGRADVETVRAVGFDDASIITIAASASFENFLGRVAAGLGVRLEGATFDPIVLERIGMAMEKLSAVSYQPAPRGRGHGQPVAEADG